MFMSVLSHYLYVRVFQKNNKQRLECEKTETTIIFLLLRVHQCFLTCGFALNSGPPWYFTI